MRVSAIVLCAGKGKRFAAETSKVLFPLKGKPLIYYSLKTLAEDKSVEEIILAVNHSNKTAIEELVRRWPIDKIKACVLGGRRRQDSVRNALRHVSSQADLVLIHDGARPFINPTSLKEVIRTAARKGAAILAVPINYTIKKGKETKGGVFVTETIARQDLWQINTPQVFRRQVLLEAYRRFGDKDVTDDSSLLEHMGCRVAIVRDTYQNIKLTTLDDMPLAEAIAKSLCV